MYRTLARVESQAGHGDQVEANLRRGAKAADKTEDRVSLLWFLANSLIDNAEYDKLSTVRDQLDTNKVRPELMDFLDGADVGPGGWAAAARTLEAVLPRLPNRPDFNLAYQANLLLGQCYERLGQADGRLLAFQRAVAIDPQGVAGQVGLGASLAALGRINEALNAYRQVVDEVPAARVDVARLLLARTLRLPEPKRDPKAWQDVDRALDEAAAAVPDAVDVPILRAQALAARAGSTRPTMSSRRPGTRGPNRSNSGRPWPAWNRPKPGRTRPWPSSTRPGRH